MSTHAERLARIEARLDAGLTNLEKEADQAREWRQSMDDRLRNVETIGAKHGAMYGMFAGLVTTILTAAFTGGPKV